MASRPEVFWRAESGDKLAEKKSAIDKLYKLYKWVFPKIVVPKYGWFISWKIHLKWMIWRYLHFRKHRVKPPNSGMPPKQYMLCICLFHIYIYYIYILYIILYIYIHMCHGENMACIPIMGMAISISPFS